MSRYAKLRVFVYERWNSCMRYSSSPGGTSSFMNIHEGEMDGMSSVTKLMWDHMTTWSTIRWTELCIIDGNYRSISKSSSWTSVDFDGSSILELMNYSSLSWWMQFCLKVGRLFSAMKWNHHSFCISWLGHFSPLRLLGMDKHYIDFITWWWLTNNNGDILYPGCVHQLPVAAFLKPCAKLEFEPLQSVILLGHMTCKPVRPHVPL